MTFHSINPTNGEPFANYEEWQPREVQDVIGKVHDAYLAWRRVGFDQRARLMRKAAETLHKHAQNFGRPMAQEMGKPVRDGVAEVHKCALGCAFYADNAARFLAREPVLTEARKSFITFNPIGVVLAVMPWNFPFWQVFRFAAPSLMAGNAALLKHASNVPGCELAIETVFREAGFPEHLFRTLMISNKQVDAVIEHPLVRAVTLTGSGPAGRAVAGKVGAMLKKTVLELGGSDPYVILEDADIEVAANVSTKGRLVNSGQSCIAAKRFIVVEEVRREFEERFVEHMSTIKMGDPLDETTQMGPLARHDLRCIGKSRPASPRGRVCCSAAPCRTTPAPIIRRRCLPTCARACRPMRRSCSALSRRSSRRGARRKQLRPPTIQCSDSVAA
jgi:succinate-semialdehyde dehydrogenase/glutarate-semialdehyde dehydrogenase